MPGKKNKQTNIPPNPKTTIQTWSFDRLSRVIIHRRRLPHWSRREQRTRTSQQAPLLSFSMVLNSHWIFPSSLTHADSTAGWGYLTLNFPKMSLTKLSTVLSHLFVTIHFSTYDHLDVYSHFYSFHVDSLRALLRLCMNVFEFHRSEAQVHGNLSSLWPWTCSVTFMKKAILFNLLHVSFYQYANKFNKKRSEYAIRYCNSDTPGR